MGWIPQAVSNVAGPEVVDDAFRVKQQVLDAISKAVLVDKTQIRILQLMANGTVQFDITGSQEIFRTVANYSVPPSVLRGVLCPFESRQNPLPLPRVLFYGV